MTEPFPDADGRPDEAYADAYVAGYSEGLREALREILSHASRGHTAQELRMLIESRIGRIPEDVEAKRRNLLAPPRRPAWGPLLRSGRPPTPLVFPPRLPELVPGRCYLFREERPSLALEFLSQYGRQFPRCVALTLRSTGLPTFPPERLRRIVIGADPGGEGSSLGEMAGIVREATQADGGALVYLDAIETLATDVTTERALQFVNVLTGQIGTSSSVLVVSADPRAIDEMSFRRLQKGFGWVA